MSSFTRVLAVTAVGAAMALLSSVDRAAAGVPAPCAAEAEKLCQGVPAGAGRVLACLQAHVSKLSPECQQALETAKRPVDKRRFARQRGSQQWASACTGDIQKLCKEIPAGAGRIAECLAQHQSALSDSCKAAFPPRKGK